MQSLAPVTLFRYDEHHVQPTDTLIGRRYTEYEQGGHRLRRVRYRTVLVLPVALGFMVALIGVEALIGWLSVVVLCWEWPQRLSARYR